MPNTTFDRPDLSAFTRLEELSRCRIQSIGVGPGREATIVRYPLM